MDSSRTTKTPISFGRFLNDKRETSYHERGSKVKKMEKARRVVNSAVREILKKSAPCVSGDAHAETMHSETDSGMDFSSDSKYRQYLDRNSSQKPTAANAQRARSHTRNTFTPPGLSILTSVAADRDVPSAAGDNSLLGGETSQDISRERAYPVEISRWSLDTEDFSLANQHPELSACEKHANINTLHDSVASTVPFPSIKEFNAFDTHIPFNRDAVGSQDSREVYSSYSSPYPGTDALSDSETSSPTDGTYSPTSLYSQGSGSPSLPSDAFIVNEPDTTMPSETHIRRIALEESSKGFPLQKHPNDCFDVKMNRRGAVYSDFSLDLGDLRLSTRKPDSTISSDDCIHGQEPGKSTSMQLVQRCDDRRFNHERKEQGHLPTLLSSRINLHKIRNTTGKDSPGITGHVVRPAGSTYVSSDPRVSERF